MARTEIGLIIDELVTIEQGLTGTKVVYDETPESVAATLAWLNFPIEGSLNETPGASDDIHVIGCACVKRRALLPQDDEMLRPMITRFADAISDNVTLGGTVTMALASSYEYGIIDMLSSPDDLMFGILFRVEVYVADTVSVSG